MAGQSYREWAEEMRNPKPVYDKKDNGRKRTIIFCLTAIMTVGLVITWALIPVLFIHSAQTSSVTFAREHGLKTPTIPSTWDFILYFPKHHPFLTLALFGLLIFGSIISILKANMIAKAREKTRENERTDLAKKIAAELRGDQNRTQTTAQSNAKCSG